MGLLVEKNATYHRRNARMFFVAAAVVALVAGVAAPDTFGRVAGGVIAFAICGRAAYELRQSKKKSG